MEAERPPGQLRSTWAEGSGAGFGGGASAWGWGRCSRLLGQGCSDQILELESSHVLLCVLNFIVTTFSSSLEFSFRYILLIIANRVNKDAGWGAFLG